MQHTYMYETMGLRTQDVMERIQQGKINQLPPSISKSRKQIFKENICTLFNFLNLIIAIALGIAGAWSNMLFVAIIAANIIIGIAQELHAKKLVDELSLLMVSSADVIRDGSIAHIAIDELVEDDLLIMASGQQVCCDAIVLQGDVEVNEALLTGESDLVHKCHGDKLLSGSSILSGTCRARIQHVGEDNYAARIAQEAKKQKAVNSQLLHSMKKVTRITCIVILPLAILLLYEAFVLRDVSFYEGILSSSAALLGMLPKGLVLLISVSLAAGVTRLAKKKILIQDLYSLESLAHVDTLCLDKTGTITDGKLQVKSIIPLSSFDIDKSISDHIASYLYHCDDNNATYEALCSCFDVKNVYEPTDKIAFSSLRKWSSITFDNFGTLFVGAPERLLPLLPHAIKEQMNNGFRVIVIVHSKETPDQNKLPVQMEPLFAIIMQDTIRDHVNETLTYFKNEGIDVKIISGDHIDTVTEIARQAGVDKYTAAIDMSNVEETFEAVSSVAQTHTVFARVTPKQKKLLVQALQKNGHKVAMTGDGVNDMLALKEADCSIAVAQGSDAVKQMSQIVLLESDFSSLPDILSEGRRVVNNVTRVAGVFFIKTLYSSALSLLCVLMNIPFPFIPIQITLIDAAVEAFPAFLSIMEKDTSPVKGTFLATVMRKAIPYAFAIIVMITILFFDDMGMSERTVYTIMYLSIAVMSIQAVITSCLPMNTFRFMICAIMVTGFMSALLLFPDLLQIHIASLHFTLMVAIASSLIAAISVSLFQSVYRNSFRGQRK